MTALHCGSKNLTIGKIPLVPRPPEIMIRMSANPEISYICYWAVSELFEAKSHRQMLNLSSHAINSHHSIVTKLFQKWLNISLNHHFLLKIWGKCLQRCCGMLYMSNCSGVTSRKGCSMAHAALFTSKSTGPMSLSAASVVSHSDRSTHTGLIEGHWRSKI